MVCQFSSYQASFRRFYSLDELISPFIPSDKLHSLIDFYALLLPSSKASFHSFNMAKYSKKTIVLASLFFNSKYIILQTFDTVTLTSLPCSNSLIGCWNSIHHRAVHFRRRLRRQLLRIQHRTMRRACYCTRTRWRMRLRGR